MKVDKGSHILNYLFGAFIVLSSIKIGCDLYEKYNTRKLNTRSCNCGKK